MRNYLGQHSIKYYCANSVWFYLRRRNCEKLPKVIIVNNNGWTVEELNEPLRNRDKMEDDAIAQLSDQLVALIISLAGIYCNNRPFV
jgi:hypothetical protein